MAKDYYEILGVSKSASKDEIKRAYKKLAKKHHPDMNKDDPDATEKFKELNEAASVLGNEEKRQQYDNIGHSAFEHASKSGGTGDFSGFDYSSFAGGFDDIFEMFTRGFGGFGRHSQRRGDDLRYDLTMSLEEAAEGAKKTIKVRKHVTCEACSGKGGTGVKTCDTCKGQRMVRRMQRTPFGVFQTQSVCTACAGTGETIDDECNACSGEGVRIETVELDVKIPIGVDNGTRVRVSREGDAGPRGSPSGDLYIFITIPEHPIFERQHDDLLIEAPISFSTAVLGGTITVPTLDGEADVKIPKGTQSHTIFRLRGKGISDLHTHRKGDQFVKVVINTPDHLTKKQEKALKDYADLEEDDESLLKEMVSKLKKGFK
ncbi:molecular chaperone DnaJ [Candidatus Woesearchaeota archaeon]|nr:molecular chaperone DnaJ [Candidatus Woesearchaeota archaeon]